MTRNRNRFFEREQEIFHIVNDDGVVGHLRIKPSSISWSPKNSKKWYTVSLDRFADFAEKNGRKA